MSKCIQQSRLGSYSPSSTISSSIGGGGVGGSNRESLNSSLASCTSSVSSRWEEMNMISKELHSIAVKNLSISDDLSSLSPLSVKPSSSPPVQPRTAQQLPKSSHLSDLDSTLDLLKNYIDKYKCKPTRTQVSDSSFEDSVYSNDSRKKQVSKYLDTSISSIAPVADENQRTIDDLLSLCSESTLTTNSDELYGSLAHYSDKYLFTSSYGSPTRRRNNLDISFTSLESNKENIKPKVTKKSKTSTTKKTTTPSNSNKKTRPQSVKVSTLKSSTKLTSSTSTTTEEKKAKKTPTSKRATTPKPISKTVETKKSTPLVTPRLKRSSSTSKIPSSTTITSSSVKQHKIVIPKTPEIVDVPVDLTCEEESLSLPGTPLEPSPNLSSSLSFSSGATSFEEIIIHAPNYYAQKDVETKSCQTSMIVEQAKTKEEVKLDDSLTTLGGDDEIAFKIIGATDKIEKVEVYLKNSKGHTVQPTSENAQIEQQTSNEKVTIQETPSYTDQSIQASSQSPKTLYQYVSTKNERSNPSSPEHYSSSSYSSSSEDAENALEKLKSIYNRYFIQNHQ